MSVIIERDGEERWIVRCAPQCMTDILVQVCRVDAENDDPVEFTFCLGELMREELEGGGDMAGLLHADDTEAAVIERWVAQLEAYASIMRSALRCRRPG